MLATGDLANQFVTSATCQYIQFVTIGNRKQLATLTFRWRSRLAAGYLC